MNSLNDFYDVWRDIMDNKSDPRTTNWLMMSSPLPTMAVSLTYIVAVTVIGPRIMANRKPIDAKKLQLFYNIFHLVINIYLLREACVNAWLAGYSFRCQSVDFSMTGTPMRIATGCWFYYMSKFTDFFETVIYVLMKRFDMVNLYHVAHHSIMPVSVWWGVKFLAGGHSTFFGFINTAVHVVIYSYFVVTSVFPNTKKYFFWWKSFYPFFQIGQFAFIFIHAFQLIWSNECSYPIAFVYFIGAHAVLFYILIASKIKADRKKEDSKKCTAVRKKNDDVRVKGTRNLPKTIHQMLLSSNLCFNMDNFN